MHAGIGGFIVDKIDTRKYLFSGSLVTMKTVKVGLATSNILLT